MKRVCHEELFVSRFFRLPFGRNCVLPDGACKWFQGQRLVQGICLFIEAPPVSTSRL